MPQTYRSGASPLTQAEVLARLKALRQPQIPLELPMPAPAPQPTTPQMVAASPVGQQLAQVHNPSREPQMGPWKRALLGGLEGLSYMGMPGGVQAGFQQAEENRMRREQQRLQQAQQLRGEARDLSQEITGDKRFAAQQALSQQQLQLQRQEAVATEKFRQAQLNRPIELNKDTILVAPTGKEITRGPASTLKEDAPQDYRVWKAEQLRKNPNASVDYEQFLKMRTNATQHEGVYGEPPIAIHTTDAEGDDIVTYKTRAEVTGKTFAAPRTADMRNRETARKLVAPGIKAIKALSQRIITKLGPAQRINAAERGIEAVLGNDPEFRTYQDAKMALAGNLAVAQQGSRPSDADIKAIWVPLIPDPFRDTDESANMKWDMIYTLSQIPQETATETPKRTRIKF